MRDGGKGDKPRPLGVSMEQFDKNFDAIFGKKKQKEEELTHNQKMGVKLRQMIDDLPEKKDK